MEEWKGNSQDLLLELEQYSFAQTEHVLNYFAQYINYAQPNPHSLYEYNMRTAIQLMARISINYARKITNDGIRE